jgi:DNA topoisomerase III
VTMNFTSVTGHIISMDFEEKYGKKYWSKVSPIELFKSINSLPLLSKDARIVKHVDPEKKPLSENLMNLARQCQAVILWLDCDREGEAIAFEVLEICQSGNRNLQVFRAQFSAFTKRDIEGAMLNLRDPDVNLCAVSLRNFSNLRPSKAGRRST